MWLLRTCQHATCAREHLALLLHVVVMTASSARTASWCPVSLLTASLIKVHARPLAQGCKLCEPHPNDSLGQRDLSPGSSPCSSMPKHPASMHAWKRTWASMRNTPSQSWFCRPWTTMSTWSPLCSGSFSSMECRCGLLCGSAAIACDISVRDVPSAGTGNCMAIRHTHAGSS